MSNNINISSGSKSFQNKIFGRVTKLNKPSFAYEGKIFSDSTFNNQKNIPMLEDNIFYLDNGIPDELLILDYSQALSLGGNNILNLIDSIEIFKSLTETNNSIETRNNSSINRAQYPQQNFFGVGTNTYENNNRCSFGSGFNGCDFNIP
jgi:hypothetical protein